MPKYFEKAETKNDDKKKRKTHDYLPKENTDCSFSKPDIDYFRQMVASQSLVDTILLQHSINQPASII